MYYAAVEEEKDRKFISGILLKISFAAIHTCAAGNSQLTLDICANPELIQLCRRSIAMFGMKRERLAGKGFYRCMMWVA